MGAFGLPKGFNTTGAAGAAAADFFDLPAAPAGADATKSDATRNCVATKVAKPKRTIGRTLLRFISLFMSRFMS
jgi:hypothetical protein